MTTPAIPDLVLESVAIEQVARHLPETTHVIIMSSETSPARVAKSLDDTVRGFRELVDGQHDDLPEQAFYMVGTIEEAVEKAKTIAV